MSRRIENNNIFLSSETSGTISGSLTMSNGDNQVVGRSMIYEDGKPFNGDAMIYAKLGGGGSGTVNVGVYLHNGTDYMTTKNSVAASVADDGEVQVYLNSRDFAFWGPHFGVKWVFDRATGSGDVAITEGRYVPLED